MNKNTSTKNKIRRFPRYYSPVSSCLKGSLTVETALTLPFFIFAMLTIIMLAEGIRFSGDLSAALMETSKKYSVYAYAAKNVSMNGAAGFLSGKAISMTLGKQMTLQELKYMYPENGLNFLFSSVMSENQMIDMNAIWKMKQFFPLLPINDFYVIDRARIRAFTGYDNSGKEDSSDTDEEMVFITESGSVYHRSRGCSHLNIKISAVHRSQVGGERNNNGGKYYPCEYCGGGSTDTLYITEDGDRYHTKISCPGLKRTIRMVPLSKVGGRRPCSKCGHILLTN